ncbi:phospholipid/cholesterol/gamma-HCH transport system permease protein [Breznakibacter xylanolyticus]|uniref:Phospholipid/cholesterol/gamma-HCH transport system permease protein n=1 Tax=Breznakibacter xylanolyticus TaxID=990 RepID=A0A2W7N8B1_9BACT|nr:ABC transporter permease [Breznakibacter xylanolyticus]PZX15933.1 phospholipid/cholesterol/gamma-HCH transport system permease protein [Breznakibacter xylanolyticus]
MSVFFHIGRYSLFVRQIFDKPEKHGIFARLFLRDVESLGLKSIGIVAIISVFMGAVITWQTSLNIFSPLIPRFTVGLVARDSIILEFSSTIVCLILAGRVGSNIASEIGTMRVTEQIDALDIMGINSVNYLVLPKVLACVFIFPFLVVMSMGIGLLGGWLAGLLTGLVPSDDFIYGIQYIFNPFYVVYSLIKSVIFAFIISTVSAYWGYFSSGGALEVGVASTKAVVVSSIQILLFNLLITQLLLT